MNTLRVIDYLIAILFTLCYAYQFLYIPIPWFVKKRSSEKPLVYHDFAVLICARNEAAVIGDLLDSLRHQTYPAEKLHLFVMADNCTDATAAIAESCGAKVYTRFDKTNVGKGYALQVLMDCLKRDYPAGFDGYFVFDADNLLEPDYI